ncbi:response regulator [Alsobacter sp. R-9]
MSKVIDTLQVLVVDDYATMRRIITNILQQLGVTAVDHARDGEEALRLMAGKSYDLVLCDWCMEPMSGEAFLQSARVTHPRVPVVVVSAHASASVMDRARGLGASSFLPKPFSPSALRAAIAAVVDVDVNVASPGTAPGPAREAPSLGRMLSGFLGGADARVTRGN